MRIISKFVDYYDYAVQFDLDGIEYYRPSRFDQLFDCMCFGINAVGCYRHPFDLLFVAGEVWPVVRKNPYLTGQKGASIRLATREDWKNSNSFRSLLYGGNSYQTGQTLEIESGVQAILVDLSKTLKSPVYSLRRDYMTRSMCLVPWVPVLSTTGIQDYVSAEQMYQNIEWYLMNVLRDSPDTKPPVEVSNEQKILQHGFDVKQSFRHR